MIDYDRSTALLVVDVQNDFCDPAGTLSVAGGEAVLAPINAELARARAAGALVVYTQDWHPPLTPHFVTSGGPWPEHCIAGTWGAELHPGLDAGSGEPRIRKGVGGEDGYSGFTVAHHTGERRPTGLKDLLEQAGVKRVVIAGLTTDYCVRDTALDALALGLEVTVVRAGTRAVNVHPGDGDAALATLATAGVTLA